MPRKSKLFAVISRGLFISVFFILFLSSVYSANILTSLDIDQDKEQELILENQYCKFVIKPSLGKIVSFVIKSSNTELLRDETGRKERGCLLGDYFQQQGTLGDYFNKPYSVEIITNSPNKAVVRLSRTGTTDLLKWITITKTITVYATQPVINVDYKVYNEDSSMEDYYLGLAIHNEFDSGREITLSMPLSKGILHKTLTAQTSSGTGENYQDISRGWLSVSQDSGDGIAFYLDYISVKKFYEWHKATLRSIAWFYLTQKIEHGKSFHTSFQIIPFSSMSRLDGVVKGHVGTINIESVPEIGEKTPIKVILSKTDTIPRACISVLHDGKENILGEFSPVDKNNTLSFQTEFTPEKEGLYIVRVTIIEGKENIGELERPIRIGQSKEQYILKPLMERLEEDKNAIIKKIPFPAITQESKKEEPSIQDVPPDIELTDSIKTPHIPWANPYYLGKTRVFFITHTSKEREVIEMAERFSMEFFRVTHGANMWKVPWALVKYWNASSSAMVQKKILKQQPLDVIMISAPWNSIEPEVQQLIMKRVENGTGLVIISPRVQKSGKYGYDYALALSDEELKNFPETLASSFFEKLGNWKIVKNHFITTGVPLELMKSMYSVHTVQNGDVLAEIDSHPLIVVGQYGKGRIVAINYNFDNYQLREMAFLPNIHPFKTGSGVVVFNPDYPNFQWWEYVWSMLIKSALWVSGREPELMIEKIQAEPQSIVISVDNKREQGTFNFELTIRDSYSRTKLQKSFVKSVQNGKSQIVLPIEYSSEEMHFADIIIKAGPLVVNWATALLNYPQSIAINQVKLDKEFLNPLDKIKTSITLNKPWNANSGLKIWAMLYDVRGNLWEEIPVSIADGSSEGQIEFSAGKIETIAFYVCVQIRKDTQVIDEKRVRGIIAQPYEWDDYIYALEVGSGSNNYYQPYWFNELRKSGVNMLKTNMLGATNLGWCVESGMKIADTSRIIDSFLLHDKQAVYMDLKNKYFQTGDLKYLIRPVCMNDPKYRDEVKSRIQRVVGYMKNYGKMDYTLTDELSITHFGDYYDFCFCEYCLKSFREWVKGQYKDLKELNDAYGTNFASWDEVRPITSKEAREKGKWAGWADHRKFNEYSLYEFVKWIKKEVQKIQPDATISLSGTQIPGPYNGHDVWLRCQVFDNLWAYGSGNQIIMHRSFNPGLKQLPWGGYGSSGAELKHKLWRNVLEGGYGNAFWWFPINLNPDFSLNPCSQAWKEAVSDLLTGIGKTIFTSRVEDYGIAIHYSQDSIHAAYCLDATSTFDKNRDKWVETILRNHLNFSFISYAQIEKGDLVYPKVKVLVLPYSISLSDKEAEAIRNFVRNGGTIIADMQTGIMDEHCRLRLKGAIDDVLGIKRINTEVRPVDDEGKWHPVKEWNFIPEDSGIKLQEPGIALTTGKSLYTAGSIPGIVMNSFGKGRSWYLNFNLALGSLEKKENEMMKLINQILSLADIKPYATIVDEDGQPIRDCLIYVYHNEPMHFIGILPDEPKGEDITNKKGRLIIPSGYQLIDMRKSCAANPNEIILEPGIAHFYSLLPYSVDGIEITSPSSVQQGDILNIKVRLNINKTPGNHIIRIEIQDPSGNYVYYFSKNIVSKNGMCEYKIKLPLNATIGRWQIIAIDLPSGKKQIAEFEVKQK